VVKATVVEIDDPRWVELTGDQEPDPYCRREYLAALSAAAGSRAILVAAEGCDWRARYQLLLQPLSRDRWLARTPEYGGPSVLLTQADAAPARAIETAVMCRQALDEALTAQGVISEVFLLSPWLADRRLVAAAWSASEGKSVCLVHGVDRPQRWGRLRKGRRSDISRARRQLDLRWGAFDAAAAIRFADHYQRAMDAVGAGERWRFDADWFKTLADQAAGRLQAATAEGPDGGATAVFLTGATRAAYFLASRWGEAPGAASLALWTGITELAEGGIRGVTLGGGAGDDDNDPVLAFKRSFADEEVPLLIGARVFDAAAHDEAVAIGQARPLPPGAVAP
jgi:hypothetical protein